MQLPYSRAYFLVFFVFFFGLCGFSSSCAGATAGSSVELTATGAGKWLSSTTVAGTGAGASAATGAGAAAGAGAGAGAGVAAGAGAGSAAGAGAGVAATEGSVTLATASVSTPASMNSTTELVTLVT